MEDLYVVKFVSSRKLTPWWRILPDSNGHYRESRLDDSPASVLQTGLVRHQRLGLPWTPGRGLRPQALGLHQAFAGRQQSQETHDHQRPGDRTRDSSVSGHAVWLMYHG